MSAGARRAACVALLALGAGLAAGAAPAGAVEAAAPAAAAPAPSAGAADDVLVRALRDELARSLSELRIQGMEAPYFIEYGVEERREVTLSAVLGALEKHEEQSGRRLRVGVRVGSRELDNTGFLSSDGGFRAGGVQRELPLEDDYAALRRAIWLATDEAYKQALGQLAAKRAALKNRTREELPDLSAEEPRTVVAPVTPESLDEAAWAERVRALSAVFRAYPDLQESGASLRVVRASRTYVNSEGTLARRPADMVLLLAGAGTQAADGAPVFTMQAFSQATPAELPGAAQLAEAVGAAAKRVQSLAAAPLARKYVGPVLLAPQAAAELIALTLLPAFSGERPPLADEKQFASWFRPGAFSGRIGRRVLPAFLSVEDDPLRAQLDGRPLFGAYAVDDQGVPAQRVALVEEGVLKGLLMSRRPGYGIARSNGHGRSAGGEPPRAAPGNFIVTAAGGKSLEELKRELRERCRAEGLEQGLVVSSLGLPPASELQGSLMAMMMGGGDGGLKLAAIDATLVAVADGRETPARGLVTADFTPRAFLDVVAAGAERHVLNTQGADDGSVMGGLRGYALANSDEHGTGIPVSVAAPALLFPEIEFAPSEAPRERLPIAARPAVR